MKHSSERTSFFPSGKSTWFLLWNDLTAIKDGGKLWPWTEENHSFCSMPFLFTRAREIWSIVHITKCLHLRSGKSLIFISIFMLSSGLSNAASAPCVNNFALNDVRIHAMKSEEHFILKLNYIFIKSLLSHLSQQLFQQFAHK